MISADTNIFIYALDSQSPRHGAASYFLNEQAKNRDFVICELILVELYMALRNPVVFHKPFGAAQAVEICRGFYNNPAWQYVDYNHGIKDDLWKLAAQDNAGFRQIIDFRLALTLQFHGVTDFATANVKHFRDSGFKRVWNPLEG